MIIIDRHLLWLYIYIYIKPFKKNMRGQDLIEALNSSKKIWRFKYRLWSKFNLKIYIKIMSNNE